MIQCEQFSLVTSVEALFFRTAALHNAVWYIYSYVGQRYIQRSCRSLSALAEWLLLIMVFS